MLLSLMHAVMPILANRDLPIAAAAALASKISVTRQRGKHLIRRSLSLTSEFHRREGAVSPNGYEPVGPDWNSQAKPTR